jgi:hopanoid biosynthesis associated protein HpnK
MAKKLIINADDFGISPRVNEAVERAHSQGVLTSATIMTNMDGFPEAVAVAKRLPRLGVGVHLNLFSGRAVSQDKRVGPLLHKDGSFRYSLQTLAFLSVFSHSVRTAIKIELAAQIQRLIDTGLHPTHLDSHKHIHFFPAVYPIVCSLARRFKISAVRYCFEPAALGDSPWPLSTPEARRGAGQLRMMARFNRAYDDELFRTQLTYGLTHVGRINANFFRAVSIYMTAQTAELMTHPAVEDDPADAKKLFRLERKAELKALCEERTRKCLQDTGIELTHYGRL